MELEEKYEGYKELFFKYFVNVGEPTEQGSNIPLASVNLDTLSGTMGDGTCNLADYIQYAHTTCLTGEDTSVSLADTISTLTRLCGNCYTLFTDKCQNIYFKEEPGFFLRDDVSSDMASDFNLSSVTTGYSTGIERINEDPCFSPFTSQDQIWHLAPILRYVHENDGMEEAGTLGNEILGYVVNNGHVIYNPYYSALVHNWTYLDLSVDYSDRIDERNESLEYTVKVKRGANNWYFAYGFKKAYEAFGGSVSGWKRFWSSLWYKPFIFLADRVWEPIVNLFGGEVKNTSYYSMAIAGGAWYNDSYESRVVRRFNESLEEAIKDGSTDVDDLFMPQLVFLTSKTEDVDYDLLRQWLEAYPDVPTSGTVTSPITFMYLYNWWRTLKGE